jgi:hypothetical protein
LFPPFSKREVLFPPFSKGEVLSPFFQRERFCPPFFKERGFVPLFSKREVLFPPFEKGGLGGIQFLNLTAVGQIVPPLFHVKVALVTIIVAKATPTNQRKIIMRDIA